MRARARQIMCTIHQPSSDICENFDSLILLSCGRLLYCGAWSQADAYFEAAGFPCAPAAPPLFRLTEDCLHGHRLTVTARPWCDICCSCASMSGSSVEASSSSSLSLHCVCTAPVTRRARRAGRRPGFRSTAEHLLTVCKDKESAVPRLAQDYEQLASARALVRRPGRAAARDQAAWRAVCEMRGCLPAQLRGGSHKACHVQMLCAPGLQCARPSSARTNDACPCMPSTCILALIGDISQKVRFRVDNACCTQPQ